MTSIPDSLMRHTTRKQHCNTLFPQSIQSIHGSTCARRLLVNNYGRQSIKATARQERRNLLTIERALLQHVCPGNRMPTHSHTHVKENPTPSAQTTNLLCANEIYLPTCSPALVCPSSVWHQKQNLGFAVCREKCAR